MAKKKPEILSETCPHCDFVNEFVWNPEERYYIRCLNCGAKVLLCSICDPDNCDCSNCKYEKQKGYLL